MSYIYIDLSLRSKNMSQINKICKYSHYKYCSKKTYKNSFNFLTNSKELKSNTKESPLKIISI